MEFDSRKEKEGTVVSIRGRMDAVTTPEIENELASLVSGGVKRLVVDLQGLEYISSAGLRSFLATAKKLKVCEGSLVFANVGGHVTEVFRISGFYSLFTVCDSVGDALVWSGKAE
jgi:anti-anti-sigma factor